MPLWLTIIYYILFGIVTFNTFYNAFLFIVGILPIKQKYPIVEDKNKFVVLVPCHNEGSIIAATVENYKKIDYKPELFEIYFIADNCNDDTAEQIKKAIDKVGANNFYCLERNVDDPNKKGKPHALRWAMEELEQRDHFYRYFDFFLCLDADNFVDADILKHFNSQYISVNDKKKPVMIQCYLDCKNNEGLIARGYFANYRIANRCTFYARSVVHLNTLVSGTGFIIALPFLKEIGGYNCSSLTEDLEIQTVATLKGKRILFNMNTRIYDEKPTGFHQAIVQRTRWAQGHWYLFFKYGWKLLLSMFNPLKIRFIFKRFDMIFYLFGMAYSILTFIFGCFSFGIMVASFFMPGIQPFIPPALNYFSLALGIIGMFLITITSLYDGNDFEKKRIVKDFFVNNFAVIFIGIILTISSFIGLFKCHNQKVWKKTAHKHVNLDAK